MGNEIIYRFSGSVHQLVEEVIINGGLRRDRVGLGGRGQGRRTNWRRIIPQAASCLPSASE
jgi:hypothetical protein